MKTIKICDQPGLGLGRTLQITLDGLKYRMFRASVTLAVIAVAVAFLMNIVSESVIKSGVSRSVRNELKERRLVLRWASRLTAAPDASSIVRDLAAIKPGDPGWTETRRIGGFADDELASMCKVSREADLYLRFFESVGYDRLRRLVHTAAGTEIFERLAAPAAFEEFQTRLASMKSVRFVAPLEDFRSFTASWSVFAERVDRLEVKYAEAIKKINDWRGETPVLRALSDRKPEFIQLLRESGFELDDVMAEHLAVQAMNLLNVQAIERSIEDRAICQVVAQNADIMPADVTMRELWKLLASKSGAEAYLARAKTRGMDAGTLDADTLVNLAHSQKRDAVLVKADSITADAGGGWLGIGERMSWLLVVSMLVCAIGISNAMLMTVTERFREIATMKCLGALDGFIMLVFVLEACCLGLAGGIVGAMLGNFIGIGRMAWLLGSWILQGIPWTVLVLWTAGAIGVGILLAAVAAVYPSFKAARLAPMEAMRIE